MGPTECHCLSACCFCARSYIDVTSYQSKAGQFHLNSIKWSLSYVYKHSSFKAKLFSMKTDKKKNVFIAVQTLTIIYISEAKKKSILGGRNKD